MPLNGDQGSGIGDRQQRQMELDYAITFGSSNGARVLADLANFCFAEAETFHPDPYCAAYNQGHRRVYLRIVGMIKKAARPVDDRPATAVTEEEEPEHV